MCCSLSVSIFLGEDLILFDANKYSIMFNLIPKLNCKFPMKKNSEVEFPLPQEMIHHVQSFLEVKEAAQSSILSKSWHSAWSTRPNLDFDVLHFGNVNQFWEFTEKTMQRYVESNLKIERFRLCLGSRSVSQQKMAKELIVKAMKMGTVDFNFKNHWPPITLPREVLESETLTRLYLYGCKLGFGKERKVSCSGLKSLCFEYVELKSDTIIWDIVSSCPLIENFILLHTRVYVSVPTYLYRLDKLKSLILHRVDVVDSSFFSDLSSKFPLLENLTLVDCDGYKGMEICSPSLKYMSFSRNNDYDHLLWAKCDVPNIRKFEYKGRNLPSLSFKTASREWESDITICCYCGSAEWFIELNKFLDCLRLSRISLCLDIFSFDVVGRDVDFQGFCGTAVENLKIGRIYCRDPIIVEFLFQSCRPKFITHYCYPSLPRNMFLTILYKALARRIRSTLFVLEEVNVELFEESVAEWRPLPWETLWSNSSKSKGKKQLRLQLRWSNEVMQI